MEAGGRRGHEREGARQMGGNEEKEIKPGVISDFFNSKLTAHIPNLSVLKMM